MPERTRWADSSDTDRPPMAYVELRPEGGAAGTAPRTAVHAGNLPQVKSLTHASLACLAFTLHLIALWLKIHLLIFTLFTLRKRFVIDQDIFIESIFSR